MEEGLYAQNLEKLQITCISIIKRAVNGLFGMERRKNRMSFQIKENGFYKRGIL